MILYFPYNPTGLKEEEMYIMDFNPKDKGFTVIGDIMKAMRFESHEEAREAKKTLSQHTTREIKIG